MGFLSSFKPLTAFGQPDVEQQQEQPFQPPQPFGTISIQKPSSGVTTTGQKAVTEKTPVGSQLAPTGPSVTAEGTAVHQAPQQAAPAPVAPGTINGQAPGEPKPLADKAPNTTGAQAASVTPEDAKPVAPTVVGDDGKHTDERDPVTGVVLDKNANNKPVATIGKTYVGDDGSVHYATSKPDGSPLSPTADKEGWAKLTTEQQKAALQDYKTRVEAWKTEHATDVPDYLDPEELDKLDPDGQLAAIDRYFSDNPDAEATPKLEVGDDGIVKYTKQDKDGNLIEPWTLDGWKNLSAEQQAAAKSQYATDLRNKADADETTAAEGVAGTGIPQDQWDGMTDSQKADALNGIKPPKINADGSSTVQDGDDPKATTTSKDGKVVSRTFADGSSVVYGDAGASTTTGADGLVTTVDSQGNKTYSAAVGTAARKDIDEKAKAGFNPDGTKMPYEQAWFQSHAADPANPTQKERDEYEQAQETINKTGWSAGEAVARAAVQAGILPQDVYNKLADADFAHSFGAWVVQNVDIAQAIMASNLDITNNRQQPGPKQTGKGAARDPAADSYFASLRGNQDYVPASSLTQTDFTDGTQRYDPRDGYQDFLAEVAGRGIQAQYGPGYGSTYNDPNAPPASFAMDPNWQPQYGV